MNIGTLMDSLYGRVGTLKSGLTYQDFIALELMVDFLEHKNKYEWIFLEADNVGSLDDIVVKLSDGSHLFKQVKFSHYSNDPSYLFDMPELTKSKNIKSKSLLKKWYESLKKNPR